MLNNPVRGNSPIKYNKDMKKNEEMKRLLLEFIQKDLSEEGIIEVCKAIVHYRRACRDFDNSTTPESTALARWSLKDARDEWSRVAQIYELTNYNVEQLIK